MMQYSLINRYLLYKKKSSIFVIACLFPIIYFNSTKIIYFTYVELEENLEYFVKRE